MLQVEIEVPNYGGFLKRKQKNIVDLNRIMQYFNFLSKYIPWIRENYFLTCPSGWSRLGFFHSH